MCKFSISTNQPNVIIFNTFIYNKETIMLWLWFLLLWVGLRVAWKIHICEFSTCIMYKTILVFCLRLIWYFLTPGKSACLLTRSLSVALELRLNLNKSQSIYQYLETQFDQLVNQSIFCYIKGTLHLCFPSLLWINWRPPTPPRLGQIQKERVFKTLSINQYTMGFAL